MSLCNDTATTQAAFPILSVPGSVMISCVTSSHLVTFAAILLAPRPTRWRTLLNTLTLRYRYGFVIGSVRSVSPLSKSPPGGYHRVRAEGLRHVKRCNYPRFTATVTFVAPHFPKTSQWVFPAITSTADY
jgi:hypothetical protein